MKIPHACSACGAVTMALQGETNLPECDLCGGALLSREPLARYRHMMAYRERNPDLNVRSAQQRGGLNTSGPPWIVILAVFVAALLIYSFS